MAQLISRHAQVGWNAAIEFSWLLARRTKLLCTFAYSMHAPACRAAKLAIPGSSDDCPQLNATSWTILLNRLRGLGCNLADRLPPIMELAICRNCLHGHMHLSKCGVRQSGDLCIVATGTATSSIRKGEGQRKGAQSAQSACTCSLRTPEDSESPNHPTINYTNAIIVNLRRIRVICSRGSFPMSLIRHSP